MKLLTQEIRDSFPSLSSQSKAKDPIVYAKFFNPAGQGTWYAIEFDGEDRFFGWAEIFTGCGELGYFSLSELESVECAFGLGIERDIHFEPKPLSQCK